MTLIAVVEGDTDFPVVQALARSARLEVPRIMDMAGKAQIDRRLLEFSRASKGSPWLVLRDLDNDAPCAPSYVASIHFERSQWFCLRLAVRELESWLLADSEALARYLHIPERRIPVEPDAEEDPTRTLVELARGSKRKRIKDAMVPKEGRRTPVGPLYEHSIIEFASQHWSLDRACERSPSLRKARAAVNGLGQRWNRHIRGD